MREWQTASCYYYSKQQPTYLLTTYYLLLTTRSPRARCAPTRSAQRGHVSPSTTRWLSPRPCRLRSTPIDCDPPLGLAHRPCSEAEAEAEAEADHCPASASNSNTHPHPLAGCLLVAHRSPRVLRRHRRRQRRVPCGLRLRARSNALPKRQPVRDYYYTLLTALLTAHCLQLRC